MRNNGTGARPICLRPTLCHCAGSCPLRGRCPAKNAIYDGAVPWFSIPAKHTIVVKRFRNSVESEPTSAQFPHPGDDDQLFGADSKWLATPAAYSCFGLFDRSHAAGLFWCNSIMAGLETEFNRRSTRRAKSLDISPGTFPARTHGRRRPVSHDLAHRWQTARLSPRATY
jgi:hypothetical protein